jgi:hypothetical protein
MTKHSECEGETARCAQIIRADDRFETHPKGHTKYLLRYRVPATDEAFVIEKRKGTPTIYIGSSRLGAVPFAFSESRLMPEGPTGRNSNLKAVFGIRELLAIKPQNDVDFLAAVGAVA